MKKLVTIIGLLSISYTTVAFADYRVEVKSTLKCMGTNIANESEVIFLMIESRENQGKMSSKVEYRYGSSDGIVFNPTITIENAPAMRAESEGVTNLTLYFQNEQHKFNLGIGGAVYDEFRNSQDEAKEYMTKGRLLLDGKTFLFNGCIIKFTK